jgi:signal transduction histidine kinase
MDTKKVDVCQGNILIVDDSADSLRLLSTTLSKRGYKVRHAINSSMALIGVEAAKPDLILLDIQMPELDGYQLCQKFQASPLTQEIPIIFLSSFDEGFDKVRAFAVGGSDYISKPFQIEEVLARIENQLTIAQLKKQLISNNLLLKQEIKQHQEKEEELKKAKEIAEAASYAKMRFIAKMSHELRTPLHAILGFTQLMQQDKILSQTYQEYLSIINRSGEHLLSLINDILEISKLEAGKTRLNYSNLDLYKLLESLLPLWEMRSKSKGLYFKIDCTPDLPKYIKGDQKKLKQILINLVENAIKFTEIGGVTLKITRQENNDDTNKNILINFLIEDTGPGISLEEIENLFEPFTQATLGYKYEQGSGLGLTISRELVNLMGGELKVTSILNQGTTFTFNLPTQLGETAEFITKKFTKKVIGLAPEQKKYRILVAEDNWSNRTLLVKILEPLGFELREAQNGEEALKIIDQWRPDLIWIDLKMPVMDGYKTINHLKQDWHHKEIVIIAMTASLLEDEQNLVLSLGCHDFIRKPFERDMILNKIAEHLGVRYIYEELSEDKNITEKNISLNEQLTNITYQSFNVMSCQWINELNNISKQLDPELVVNLLKQIPPQHEYLAKYLQDLVDNFRFDLIIDMTQKALLENKVH